MTKICRKRHGRGFTYQDQQGRTVRDSTLRKWIEQLAIPPAWDDVEINPDRQSKIHATGRDSAGRKQYIYNQNWRENREAEKFNRIIRFGEQLETMRRVTGQHLRQPELSRDKVMATIVRLIDEAYFRPGNDSYTKTHDTYGITTLRSKHVDVDGDKITFTYTGKHGKEHVKQVRDERLARVVRQADNVPGHEVFKYFDEQGNKVDVTSSDLNAYIKDVMGEDFSAKDFRTWAGTLLAAIALDELGCPTDKKSRQKNIVRAVEQVAKRLGNTKTIAKSSYIDPRILETYMDGRTISHFAGEVDKELQKSKLPPEEIAVLKLLKSHLDQA